MQQGRYDEALELYHAALATDNKVHGKDSSDRPTVADTQSFINDIKRGS